MQVHWPAVQIQRAISHILGSLDDKINLNRRMNETLESIARVLFRSWFVDFDPVHSKQEGHEPPGLDAATASLFTESFEDSPVGSIPKGWRMATIGEVADINEMAIRCRGPVPSHPLTSTSRRSQRDTSTL